jgi:Protein of unknown function (DUF3011)
MHKFIAILACTLAGLWVAPVDAQGGYGGVRCESRNNRYNECHVGRWRGVELVRQHSNADCIEGVSWGFRGDAIWVDRGCAADFAEGRGGGYDDHYGNSNGRPGYGGQVVRCKSRGYEPNYCPADARRSGVYIERQISKAPCIEGRTWGSDHRGIWVAQGCEADFRVDTRY